jgi:hypothetical protein
MFRRMKRETPEQKWNRLQALVQAGIERAYPNPKRSNCPNQAAIAELAGRSAGFDDSIEEDPQWRHVTHCSPCYAEYLEEFRKRRPAGPLTPAG